MSDLSDYFGNVFQGLFDGILCQIPLESCQVGYHIDYLTNKEKNDQLLYRYFKGPQTIYF